MSEILKSKKGPGFDELMSNEQSQPQITIPRAEGKSIIEAAEEYFGCRATPASELPQEDPSEEYLIETDE
ncbi:MAG: hypothetical protein K2G44_04945 [Clostridia bacterium]|nr:hypothetical protein [Clostridia bacterium]